MATGHVSKDSWTRCDAPSMLYDATRRPELSRQTPKIAVNTTDTLNAKVRLKKEIVDKLENKGLELSHESYVAVVQVGKYMFMAIMLPVYLCCYGMPRWFLMTALPQLFMALKKQSLAMGKMINQMRKRVIDLMKGMIEQLIGDALKMTKDRAKNFQDLIARNFNRILGPVRNLFKRIAELRDSTIGDAAKSSWKFYGRAEESVLEMNQWAAEKSREAFLRIQTAALNLFHSFDRSILTPLMNFIAPPFVFSAGLVRSAKAGLDNTKAKLKRQLKKITKPVVSWAKKAAAKVVDEVRKRIEKAIEPLQNWMIEKKEVLNAYWQTIQSIVFNPMIQVGMAMKSRFNTFSKRFQTVKKIFSVPKSVLKFAWNMVPKRFKESMKDHKESLFNFGHALKGIAKGAASGCFEMIVFGFQQIGKIGSRILAFIRFWKETYQRVAKLLSSIPGKLWQRAKIVLKGLALVAGRVFFVFQVLFALLMIAFLDGLQELQDRKTN